MHTGFEESPPNQKRYFHMKNREREAGNAASTDAT